MPDKKEVVGCSNSYTTCSVRTDKKAQVANRKLKADEKFEANIARQATIAASRNKAEDTASNSLCTDLLDLQNQLLARCNSKDARLTFLKD